MEEDIEVMKRDSCEIGGGGRGRCHPWRKVLGLTVISILLSVQALAQSGKQGEILVIGTGAVVEGNTASAREAAISDALIRGVEEYLSRRLGSQGMANNFPRLIQELIPKAREVVGNFNILAAEEVDRHYKVLVRLKINEEVMEEKFREIGVIETGGPPVKVLFLVSQIELPSGEASHWWRDPEGYTALSPTELALDRAFEERGFQPINRMLKGPEVAYLPEMKALDLTSADALRWGRAFSAEVVIYGRCTISEKEEIFVSLTALDVAREFMIDQVDQTGRVDEGSENGVQAIQRVIDEIAYTLSPSILRALSTREAEVSRLEIALKGLKSFRDFRMLRDFLEGEIEGVKSVRQTKVKGSMIWIMVEYAGGKDALIEKVLRHENLPFPVDVIETEEGEIIFNIR
jgi:hypothetical protein